MNLGSTLRTGFLLATLCAAVTACASLPAVTSGQIGCAEQDVVIVEDHSSWGTRNWTATCHGKTYFCSAIGGGQNSTPQVSCKENGGDQATAAPAAPAAPAAAGGCQYDTQCKGDRVCKAGSCVDAAPK